MKKFISVILALCLTFSVFGFAAFAGEKESNITKTIQYEMKTDCGGECDIIPTIVVPGLGQSNVWLVDEEGNCVLDDNGDKIDNFPCYADSKKLIKRALFPVLATLLTQHNIGMHACLDDCLESCFYMNMNDSEGNETKYVKLEEYPKSLAECNDYEKGEIYGRVPLEPLGKEYEDHLYYFAYNSFGNNIQTVYRLYRYIQMVKAETGHDKVNIVSISLGGTVANGLFEYYNGSDSTRPNVYNSIHKVIYIVPALDGSSIIGDVFTMNIAFLDMDYLYNGFLEKLMDEKDARPVEILLRLLPDRVVEDILTHTCKSLVKNVFSHSTNMWALVPQDDYDKAASLWLGDSSMSKIKEQTDRYHLAQVNSDKNILKLQSEGVKVFNIVDYNYRLYNIGNSWNKENADGIIDLDSTSMGCISANIGETLPAGYTQANTHCTDPSHHNHISPDRVVDASAGLLPETTFYFSPQDHESTARNEKLMALAIDLIKNDDITDVYSSEKYSQFNEGISFEEEPGDDGDSKAVKISLWLFEHFGTKGFSQLPFECVKKLLGLIGIFR